MSKPSSQLYRVTLPDVESQLQLAVSKGISRCTDKPVLFFRADDIGIPSASFQSMMECFRAHKLPLCLATVPAWLNSKRIQDLLEITGDSREQWCWHQHGYVHKNFETSGKKQEFGGRRTEKEIKNSLLTGKVRLDRLLGSRNHPVFTPPWNRCSEETLTALHSLQFKAVSRSKGATPKPQKYLADFQVNVDLHTRKEANGKESFAKLLAEIETALASGSCGIMLHHQRMNRRAEEFLDILLLVLKKQPSINFAHFGDLLRNEYD